MASPLLALSTCRVVCTATMMLSLLRSSLCCVSPFPSSLVRWYEPVSRLYLIGVDFVSSVLFSFLIAWYTRVYLILAIYSAYIGFVSVIASSLFFVGMEICYADVLCVSVTNGNATTNGIRFSTVIYMIYLGVKSVLTLL